MIFSYFLVSTLLILTLSFFMTRRFMEKSERDYIESYTEIIGRISDNMSLIFSNTWNGARDAMNNDEVLQQAIFGEDFDADTIMGIRDRMVDLLIENSFLDSIYLVNGTADIVFTSYPYQCSRQEFYDKDALVLLEKQKSRNIHARSGEIFVEGREIASDYITLLYPIPESKETGRSGVVFNISRQTLQSYLGSQYTENMDFLILDAENAIVFSSQGEEGIEPDFAESIAQELNRGTETGQFSGSYGGKECEVIFKQGDAFGFTYLGMIPFERIRENSDYIFRWVLLVTFLLIFVGIILAAGFISRIYEPVSLLMEKIRKKDLEIDGENRSEFEYLDMTYDHLFRDIDDLSEKMEQYCLYRILTGEHSSAEQLREDMNACRLSFAYPCFLVFCLRFSHYQELSASYGTNRMIQFKTEIMRLCEKFFEDKTACRGIDLGADCIAMLLNAEDFSEERQKKCKAVIRDFMDRIRKKYGIWMQAGMGEPAGSSDALGECGKQAIFAVSCGMYQEAAQVQDQEILDYESVKNLENRIIEYPIELEKKMFSSLKAVDSEGAKKYCEQIFAKFRTGSPEIAQLYILKLAIPLVEMFSEEGMRQTDFYHIKRELEIRETLYEKQKYFETLFEDLAALKTEKKKMRENLIVENVVKWIREHYQDSNLTLETIAEAQKCSSSYLRRIFRDAGRNSPTDYLMEYRMEKAKEFLVSTEDTSVKICKDIGITNSKYFYSVFKKATGYTTSEYRKKFGEGKKNEESEQQD